MSVLPTEVISQFVKGTNDSSKSTNSVKSFYGTAVVNSSGIYVRLDGSEALTPVSMATDAKNNDRVLVTIEDHKASITNNITSPASGRSATDLYYVETNENGDVVVKGELRAAKEYVDELIAKNITVASIETQSAKIITLEAQQANFENATAENFTAVRAEIENLVVSNFDAKYANIDLANVDTAKIRQGFMETLMVSQGVFTSDITAAEGTFTNYLTGVNILANNITAGTLSVERLVITGSDQSVVYEINKANGTPQLSETTVDGGSLTERTVTADRIVAGSITGNEIAATTITGQHIVANSITAASLDVNSIFAQDITATGTITGINLVGATGSFSGNITANDGTIGGYKISGNKLFSEKTITSKSALPVYVDCYDSNGNQVDVQGKNVNVNERQKSSISIEPGIVTAEGWEKSYYYEVAGANHYGYNEITYNKININNGINIFTQYSSGSVRNQSEINADPGTAKFDDCMNLFMDGGNIRLHSGSIIGGEFIENNAESSVDITSSGIIIAPGNSNTAVQIEDASYLDGIDTNGNFIHLIRAMNNTCAVGDSSCQTGIYGNSLSIKCATTVSGNMKATGHIMNGNKTGWQDGKTGIYLGSEGILHIQRASSSGNPYIGFYRDADTSAGSITYDASRRFSINKDIYMNGTNIRVTDGHGLYGHTNGQWLIRPYDGDNYSNMCAVGDTSHHTSIYCSTNVHKNGSNTTYFSTTSSSDRRLKAKISDLSVYENFFMDLKPIAFKYHEGLYNTNISAMIQWGFYAQDTINAFNKNGLNWEDEELVVVEDGELTAEELKYVHSNDLLKMNYQNIMALNTYMIQKTRKEMAYQSGRIDIQEATINDLQNRLWQAEKEIKELKQAAQ